MKRRRRRRALERERFALRQHGEFAGVEAHRQEAIGHRSLELEPAAQIGQSHAAAAARVALHELETLGAAERSSHLADDRIAARFLLRRLPRDAHHVTDVRVMWRQRLVVEMRHAARLTPPVQDEGRCPHRDGAEHQTAAAEPVALQQRRACTRRELGMAERLAMSRTRKFNCSGGRKGPRSTSNTCHPASARVVAVTAPPGPDPITQASDTVSMMSARFFDVESRMCCRCSAEISRIMTPPPGCRSNSASGSSPQNATQAHHGHGTREPLHDEEPRAARADGHCAATVKKRDTPRPAERTQHARTVIGVGTLEQMLDVPGRCPRRQVSMAVAGRTARTASSRKRRLSDVKVRGRIGSSAAAFRKLLPQ